MIRSKPIRLQGFNPRGELIKTINADASVDETVFDALGRPVTAYNADALISYAYDSMSRTRILALAKEVGSRLPPSARLSAFMTQRFDCDRFAVIDTSSWRFAMDTA